MKKTKIAVYSELPERKPVGVLVANVDLVVVKDSAADVLSVLYGRCLHRGALLSDGFVSGNNLMCGVHYWDYRIDSGVSAATRGSRPWP